MQKIEKPGFDRKKCDLPGRFDKLISNTNLTFEHKLKEEEE